MGVYISFFPKGKKYIHHTNPLMKPSKTAKFRGFAQVRFFNLGKVKIGHNELQPVTQPTA